MHGIGLGENCQDGPSTNANGIYYFSMGGSKASTSLFDPLDIPFALIKRVVYKKEDADGLVGLCSSRFGKALKSSYKMNHLDFINHTLSFGAPGIESIYLNYANKLKNLSL